MMPMEKNFNAAESEARLSKVWIESKAFRAGANASRPETFCIMIPPPNVTGSLHMGHAFKNSLAFLLGHAAGNANEQSRLATFSSPERTQ